MVFEQSIEFDFQTESIVNGHRFRFNPDVNTLVPPEQLEKSCFGGELEFKYVSLSLS